MSAAGAGEATGGLERRRSLPQRRRAAAPYSLAAPGMLWLFALLVTPIVLLLYTSLQSGSFGLGDFRFTWEVSNFTDGVRTYQTELIRSVVYAGIATIAAVGLAYPMVYWIAFYGGRYRSSLLAFVLLPFFVSFVIRITQWKFLLGDQGLILGPLKALGVAPDGFRVLATPLAVIAGITNNFLPFAALPLYVTLERIDIRLLEAARDLFADPRSTFAKVVLPLSLPGLFAASVLTFVPAMGDYVNASVLGGPGTTMIGNIIQTKFLVRQDYPRAAALSMVLMIAMLLLSLMVARSVGVEAGMAAAHAGTAAPTISRRQRGRRGPRRRPVFLPVYSVVVMCYLSAPILVMILYGFNAVPGDRNSPHFFGFTLEWYRTAFEIQGLTEALRNSLVIAAFASIVAMFLGTLLGLALGRYRFRGQAAILGLLFLSIAIPEVVFGASLLSMFVTINDLEPFGYTLPLGIGTMLLSHVAFTVAFVTMTVRARVQGLDDSLEQAAQDLFAPPVSTFFHVTLPSILPAVIAGLLLAFVLSLDDFVITNFVSGQTQTFPLWVFGATRLGVPPQVNVIGTLLFVSGASVALGTAGFARFRRSQIGV